ncbi:MAG: hypothetical protein R6X31_10025 [Anaerolineae bacterium]
MSNRLRYLVWPLLTLLVLTSAARAQTGDGYDLTWWTVDGGGYTLGVSADGVYTLGGTIGQPDAGVMSDSSGIYTLGGGFWGGAGPVEHEIYLPLVLRNS